MCSYSALLLSYAPFFAGYKLHFSLYLSQFLGTMTCIRRAVLHIRPLRTPKGVPFQKELSVRSTSGGRVPSSQPLLETMIFGLIVHAYSCYQSENNSFICLLKLVIDPSVLNHFIWYDNNAIRITCQELFLDFLEQNKYDRLIKSRKSNERSGYTKLWRVI